jgi:L-ascorbate metabolism protein UlaG (beta-lactamase superfamily)
MNLHRRTAKTFLVAGAYTLFSHGPGRIDAPNKNTVENRVGRSGQSLLTVVLLFCLTLICFSVLHPYGVDQGMCAEGKAPVSNHFDGALFFNPVIKAPSPLPPGDAPKRSISRWIWRWVFENDWPKWPQITAGVPGKPPAAHIPKGSLVVTPVGHATFLIQLDGLNILTDPIWSERCSPVSWAGPKRYQAPGIRFEDLPPIDAVLVSHNHYDHLDIPTLKRLAKKGVARSITTLGNGDLIHSSGIPAVDELDWWQSVRLSKEITVTVVPAQHFSSRTPWDRNKTLWGGFIIRGPSGIVFYSGDTGYGPHFREIAQRFPSITVALLPISPFKRQPYNDPLRGHYPEIHMGPAEAVQAHLDLRTERSLAAHFQVFHLGGDGFDDAPRELSLALTKQGLKPDAFIAPPLGQAVVMTTHFSNREDLVHRRQITFLPQIFPFPPPVRQETKGLD